MASAPVSMTPPPAPADPDAQAPPSTEAPTTPAVASPSPASPSPQMDQDSKQLIAMVHDLLALGKNRPAAQPGIQKAIAGLREAMVGMMKESEPPEPAAPPTG